MTIIVHVLCPAVHRGGGERTKIRPLALHTTNPSFSATTSLSNTYAFVHRCHHSITYSFYTFSQQQCHHTFLAQSSIFLQLSSPYNSAHLIRQFPPIPLKFPVTNKCSTSSPAPLSHTSHLQSFHISSYPPTTQLS